MNKNLKKATAIVPATLLLAMAMPTSAFAATGPAQDLEQDNKAGRYTTSFDGVGISKTETDSWHMSGNYDAAIVTESGDARLRISNATTASSFGDMLFSPELTVAATEAATNNVFNASFVIEATEYQEGLQVTVSPDNGQGARDGFLRLKHENGGLTIQAIDYAADGESWETVTVASGLDVSDAHTVDLQVVKKADTASNDVNDVLRVRVDGGVEVQTATFEPYHKAVRAEDPTAAPDPEVDTLLFRTSGTAAPDLKGEGFQIDDVSMWVSTETPATHTNAYSTGFDGVWISEDETDRWHMSGSYDAAVVTEAGDAQLRISNATTSGSFDDMLFSPEATVAADETATNNVFNAGFVIEPTEYQEGLRVTVNPDNGKGGREGTLVIKHVNGGMTIEAADWSYDAYGELQFEYVEVASGLKVDKAHTVNMQVVKKADTSADKANDVFRVWIDGGAKLETATYEAYYIEEGQANPATDALLFRLSGTAAADTRGEGLLIDDLKMSVTTEAPPVKPTTPPTKPPVKPTPKPVVKPKAQVTAKATPKKNKMYVNVNPNQGKGYWNVKVQKLTKDGWRTLPGTYRTQGNAETRTINLPKGTYRTVVLPDHGHVAGVSNAVHLKK